MSEREPILIAGAGIGGLALALALARRGIASVVLERQVEIASAGAGIQLGPNAVRALQALGLAEALRPFVGEPEAIVVRSGKSGRVLNRLPLGSWIAERHGAPYWVVNRGDLHHVLLQAASATPLVTIRRGFEVISVEHDDAAAVITGSAGATVTGSMLVAADGIWSTVRQTLDMPPLTFAGATATRTVLPAAAAGSLALRSVGLWLNPHAHVVHYPLRGGRDIAVVVIAREMWHAHEWDHAADRSALHAHLDGFHASLGDALGAAQTWRKWALYTLPPLPAWTAGRVALLGDAAHPMLPYLAQGGAFALEDALTLAHCLATGQGTPEALQTYAALRRKRARQVQAASRQQGRIYRMSPPLSYIRDGVLRLTPGSLLMQRLDWLYAWQPPQ